MTSHKGPSGVFLDVNLTTREWRVHRVSRADQALYIGGKGLALKLYHDLIGPEHLAGVNPLGPENLLIFSMGVMLGSGAPCSARFEVLTRSPLTGLMVGSSCGGPFGEACRTAGWDGLIIRGRSDSLTTLHIGSVPDLTGAAAVSHHPAVSQDTAVSHPAPASRSPVEFRDASALRGLGTVATQAALNLGPREAAAVIGPAGENLVSYANIRSGHRFAGRGGVGAVMGSKNLKAVVALGRDIRVEPADPALFERTDTLARKRILRNASTKAYRAFGTNANVLPGITAGFTPVRNFRDRHHPDTGKTSGEAMAERYSTRHSSCRHCSVLCGHKGRYPDGKMRQIPEYETVGLFGSNIENFDPDIIGVWNDIMNDAGMDTISAGGTIAWAMEAGEKKLRPTVLRFGRTDNIAGVLEDIAHRRGEGAELAEGSRRLSERFGGTEFAIHVKGLEVAAYDPRASWGQGLGYAVHNKGGCHLGSYLVGLEVLLGYMPPLTAVAKARWVAFMEDVFTGLNSLQMCLFTVFGILTEPPVPRLLPKFVLKFATIAMPRAAIALMDWSVLASYFRSMTGIPMNKWSFLKAGERINKLERRMDVLMGLEASQDTLPARFTQEKQTAFPGRNTVVPIEKMVRSYYRVRRYGSDGGPASADLARLMVYKNDLRRVPVYSFLLKRIYCAVVLRVLGWFIPNVACRKASVRDEVNLFPEGFRFRLGVLPSGPSAAFLRTGDRLVRIADSRGAVDMEVNLKSIEAAWLLFSFQESTCRSEASGRLTVQGELPHTCTFIRLMDKVEILLLPRFIARRAVKKWEPVR